MGVTWANLCSKQRRSSWLTYLIQDCFDDWISFLGNPDGLLASFSLEHIAVLPECSEQDICLLIGCAMS